MAAVQRMHSACACGALRASVALDGCNGVGRQGPPSSPPPGARLVLAAAGSKAAGALNERYVWSVVPSLAAVAALMMQPAQGSLAISVLLVGRGVVGSWGRGVVGVGRGVVGVGGGWRGVGERVMKGEDSGVGGWVGWWRVAGGWVISTHSTMNR
jgi:hypothetical protein